MGKTGYAGPSREFWRRDSTGDFCEAASGLGRGDSEASAAPRVDGVKRAWNGFEDGDKVDRKVSILLKCHHKTRGKDLCQIPISTRIDP